MIKKLFPFLYLVSLLFVFLGVIKKIMHHANADWLLGTGLVLTALYTVIALYEVHNSSRIYRHEKIMWTVGFLCMNAITGLLYLSMGRKRIMKN